MRALLFNPWIADFAAFDHWTRPLNLLRLASLLRRLDWEVELYDCLDRRLQEIPGCAKPKRHRLNPFGAGHYYREAIPAPPAVRFIPREFKRYGVPIDVVEKSLREMAVPDVILIPCMMTYWYPGAEEAICMMRRVFPKACVILGGVYAALCRGHAEIHSGADAIITGRHWPEIVNRIAAAVGGKTESYGDGKTWIEPAYDLLRGDSCLPLVTSIGCPCRCAYCATHSLWPQFIQYPMEAAADSIERCVKEFHATDLVFYDDALLINREKHFLPLMEECLRRRVKARFHTPNALHVRQIDEETSRMLKRAGFVTIRLGLETAQPSLQRETGSKVDTEDYRRVMRLLLDAGFSAREVGTYLLLGLPGQSPESAWEACRLAAECGSEIRIAMISPIPGTPLFERKTDDFVIDHRSDPLLHNNSLTPWRLRRFTQEEIRRLERFAAETNGILRKNGLF
ncbi:MAG: B12-binding domain-containing radical SAM protein [Candidatus Omnitrophota bacterium]